jgi:Mg2+ and Co2+ transporter CorA
MNVNLPVLGASYDWIIIILITVLLMVWLISFMRKHHLF